MKLIIASNNAGKIREIKEILGSHFDAVLSAREAGANIDPEENANSFMGNALIKAKAYAELFPDDAVLADDSGLCVDALNGAPGIYSARFAGEGHNDEANKKKLLEEMKDVPFEKRDAHFACAMALVRGGKADIEALGRVDGKIMFTERGENGFGYDPLFLYEPAGLSFAEMDAESKNAVSHRHNALMLVLAALAEEI